MQVKSSYISIDFREAAERKFWLISDWNCPLSLWNNDRCWLTTYVRLLQVNLSLCSGEDTGEIAQKPRLNVTSGYLDGHCMRGV